MNMKNETMGNLPANIAAELDNEHPSLKPVVFAALALWLGLVSFLGSQGAFVGKADSPPLPLLLGLAIPMAVFFAAYFGWGAFRAFLLGADPRFLAAMQGWRWAGLGFLFLYAKGVLPALFAFPAGLGDMAIGISAPWMVLRLIRHSAFAASRRYMIWNILGITDFVVAVSMGVLCSGLFHGIAEFIGNLTTSPMNRLPLVLVPTYIVPFFVMLHFTALAQGRRLARSVKSGPAFNE